MAKNIASGEDVLFHEIYNIYYRIVAHLIESAEKSPLSVDKIKEFVKEFGFGETEAEFLKKFRKRDVPIFCKNNDGTYSTPLKSTPRPLSLVERRWLASIADDERMRLFLDDGEIEELKEKLCGVEPLYRKEDFHVIDGANDPDPFSDPGYRKNFRTLLSALRQKKSLQVRYSQGEGERKHVVAPKALQYSGKDDKFRLLCTVRYDDGEARRITMNVSRIADAALDESSPLVYADIEPETRTAVMKVSRERDTPERAMIHFSNYECTSRLNDKEEIVMNVKYNAEDEMELLIRVLSFGPLIHVFEPDSLMSKIKERLQRQANLKSYIISKAAIK